MQSSTAVSVARAHIKAWCSHDWEKTKELLAPNIHAVVTNTGKERPLSEFVGVDAYMERKKKSAQLIEPGSLEELYAMGDDHNAMVLVTFKIGIGPDGAMVTMARSCLYLIDENQKIVEERDTYYIIPN